MWKSLAELAERILKPGGFLIAYSGQEHLARVIKDLSKKLTYFWTCAVFHSGTQPQIIRKKVTNRWKPILIFSNGQSKSHNGFVDWLTGEKGEKENHEWAQSVVEAEYFIERFSEPTGMILDPMMGSGSTLKAAFDLKRRAMGIEIDAERFKVAESFLS
ncbi:MAG: DNA methyltransferase [Rhabdochlamydiaceae bacterium]